MPIFVKFNSRKEGNDFHWDLGFPIICGKGPKYPDYQNIEMIKLTALLKFPQAFYWTNKWIQES